MVLLTAAILGFTIDRWLKAEIARDVFFSAVGYIFRPELREEIRWILGFEWLAVRTVYHISIKTIPSEEFVEVTSSIERELENITAFSKSINGWVKVDEWRVPGHESQVLECRIRREDEHEFIEGHRNSSNTLAVEYETEQVSVAPGQRVIMYYKTVEYRRKNDMLYWTWSTATLNPQVQVECPSLRAPWKRSEGTFLWPPNFTRNSFTSTASQDPMVATIRHIPKPPFPVKRTD
jgi:hypothetical protein